MNYRLFEFPNIADVRIYSLSVKFSIVCYFNNALFKVAYSMLRFLSAVYSMLRFVTVAPLLFHLLARLFSVLFFQVLYFVLRLLYCFFR